jgi:hypothetical protein
VGFRPVAAFEPLQQATTAGAGLLGVSSFLLQGLRTLAAQLLHARADRGEVIGNAGSGHVSSSNFRPNRDGLRRFIDW